MPAVSCRDVDEACDWFFHDEDLFRLMYAANEHAEEVHPKIMKAWKDAVYSGSANWSDIIPSAYGSFRID